MSEHGKAFARASVIYPLRAAPTPTAMGLGWNSGPWPVASGPESVPVEDRIRRWHETTAIRATTAQGNRCWLAGEDTAWKSDVLALEAVELVSVSVESAQRSSYLIVHFSLLAGPRGGVESAMTALADHVRLQSAACKKLLRELGLRSAWALDDSFLRATHLFAVVLADVSRMAPRAAQDDPAVAWLVAGVDLPSGRENRYTATDADTISVAPGVRGYASPQGVALVSASRDSLRDRDLRGPFTDALVVAVLQRDALLRLSRSRAALGVVSLRWRRPKLLEHYDRFRGVWWHTGAVDHRAVRSIGDAWRTASGTDELMRQISGAVSDLHVEVRARRSETVAVVSILIALLALIVTAFQGIA
jgi:hypothetical protein